MRPLFTMTFVWFALVSWGQHAPAQSAPPRVIVEVVQTTDFVDRLEAIGTLQAAESVQISASVTETIRSIGFDDGETVTRGQLLVELEHEEESARVDEARAALEIARQEFDRASALLSSDTVAESLLQTRQRDLAFAEARLAGALAQEQDRIIRAPFDGVVGLRTISLGTTVRPGDAIVRIDDVSELNLDFSVPAVRLATLAPGQRVVAVSSALPGETFQGEVQTIDSFVDTVTRSVLVRAVVPNPSGRLKPGMLMTVNIEASPRRSITVNEAAIVPFGPDTFVYVVAPGDAGPVVEQREVTIGTRRAGEVEILSGLAEGETIITHGTMKVRPGVTVTPVEVDRAKGTPLSQFLDNT